MAGAATTFLVVGGAVLAPSLLAASNTAGGGLAVDESRTVDTYETKAPVTDGQRAAMATLRRPIAGVTDNAPKNLEVTIRFVKIMRMLIPMVGAIPSSKGLANVTADMAADIHLALCNAVAAGCEADGVRYVVASPQGSSITGERYDTQTKLVGALALGIELDDVTPLGKAFVAAWAAYKTANGIPTGEHMADVEQSMTVAARLAVAMDTQGVDDTGLRAYYDSMWSDILGYFGGERTTGKILEEAPGRIADAAKDAGGALFDALFDALGAILTSTPMLVLVGGLVVYKAVGSGGGK